jgi:hypothetical protein
MAKSRTVFAKGDVAIQLQSHMIASLSSCWNAVQERLLGDGPRVRIPPGMIASDVSEG